MIGVVRVIGMKIHTMDFRNVQHGIEFGLCPSTVAEQIPRSTMHMSTI